MAYNLSNIRNAMNKVVVVGTDSTFEANTYKYVCTLALNSAYTVMMQSSNTYIEFEILGPIVTKIKSTSSLNNKFYVNLTPAGKLFFKSESALTGVTVAVDVGLGAVKYDNNNTDTVPADSGLVFSFNKVIYNTKLLITEDTTVNVSDFTASSIETGSISSDKIVAGSLELNSMSIDTFHINESLVTNATPNIEKIIIGNWEINRSRTGNKISITRATTNNN